MARTYLLILLALVFVACTGENLPTDTGGNRDFGKIDIETPDIADDYEAPDVVVAHDRGYVPPVSADGPAADLLVRITGPGARGQASTTGGMVALTGVVFGPVESMKWTLEDGSSGVVTFSNDSSYWLSAPVLLKQGDNRITVHATGKARDGKTEITVSDVIVVTQTPSLSLASQPKITPPAFFVGQSGEAYATMASGHFGGFSSATLSLWEVDAQGNGSDARGFMLDDGLVETSGDEIQGDGVFTVKLNMACTEPGKKYFRVAAQREGGPLVKSTLVTFECLPRITQTACSNHQRTLGDARIAYDTTYSDLRDMGAARVAAINVLSRDPAVKEVGDAEETGGLWVRFDDGVVGALNLTEEGYRGSGAADGTGGLATVSSPVLNVQPINSKDILLLSPFVSDFAPNDETMLISNVANNVKCPSFNVHGPLNSSAANLSAFRRLGSYGIVAIATHGDVYFETLSAKAKQEMNWRHPGAQEIIWSGEPVNCSLLAQATKSCKGLADCDYGSECIITTPFVENVTEASGVCLDRTHADLAAGRVVMGDRTYGVTPEFIGYYSENNRFPDSLIYLGACRTLYNGTLAAEFFGAGAKAVVGYTNWVSNLFAFKYGSQFFSRMIEQRMTSGEAYGVGAQDTSNVGSFFRLFGARNLDISDYELLNVGFEAGELSAWNRVGDGRVITGLGETKPINGKFMGIISTGLGFTKDMGNITQKFCIPPNAKTLSFYWKFYSEEFLEFCGTQFQDSFIATLTDSTGKVHPLVDLKIDDFCPEKEGCDSSRCKGLYPLSKADVSFDKGDVHMTQWQRTTFDLLPILGGEPTNAILKFHCKDTGDSIYDTAVLIDTIKIE